jgi:RNA polymerase sigma-70 factor (ECF subfamily)
MSESGLIRLFDQHCAELRRFFAARSGVDDAEDLLQDLWLRIASSSPGPLANGRAYLFRMANNLALDSIRTRQRAMARDRNWLAAEGGGDMAPEARPDTALPADDQIALRQETQLLERAIAALPPGAQRALRLYRLEGLSHAEVAQMMGISRSGVEKHLAVAMKHLRDALRDCGWFATAASHKDQTDGEGKTRRASRT